MTLKQELIELSKMPSGTSVDLSQYAYGNDSSYISKVARENNLKIRTELLGGRMMVRMLSQALTDEEVKELDSYGIISARQGLPPRALHLWERELLWGRVTPPDNEFDGLIHRIQSERR